MFKSIDYQLDQSNMIKENEIVKQRQSDANMPQLPNSSRVFYNRKY